MVEVTLLLDIDQHIGQEKNLIIATNKKKTNILLSYISCV